MKKRISVLYEGCVCITVVFLIFMFFYSENDLYVKGNTQDYRRMVNHGYLVREDKSAPVGISEIYVIQPSEIPKDSNALVFRTIHQNVKVFLDDRLVFQLEKKQDTLGSKSPGRRWNTAIISLEDQGKEIRVEIQPVYEQVKGITPDFYAGARFTIYMEVVMRDLFALLLSLSAVVLGLVFMGFVIYSYRRAAFGQSLFYMGQFAVMIGIWKLSDTGLAGMLTGREDIFSYLSCLAMELLAIPFIQYMRGMFTKKDHWIWDFSCILSLAVFVISVGLQVFGIADFWETIWMNYGLMLWMLVVIFPMICMQVRAEGWNRKLKAMVVCVAACLLGLGADMLMRGFSYGGAAPANFGMLGFLIYIVVLGMISLQDARRLMMIGMQAKHLEQMAYHDQLTGLYNRAAYANDTKAKGFTAKGSMVVMLDLNNLKYCNDTYGHDKGDLYITSCADRIRHVFTPPGKCYRMGGDEFCVLLQHKTAKDCESLILQLKQETENWNHTQGEPFRAQIAAGYALFDGAEDFDIGDTRRRADKMMYKDKFAMKQHEKERYKDWRMET